MRFFKSIVNWTPKIWFPLAIVLLNGVIQFSERLYLFEYLDLFKLDLFDTLPNMLVTSGSFAVAGALINWTLLSVLLFFGCRLLYKSEGVFRNFFKIIGMCHLILLVATLIHFILIVIGLPPDLRTLEYNTTNSQESLAVITETFAPIELTVQLINIAGHTCFALILVSVVQTFFQIRWVQAFCNVCISYAIYWTLNKALWLVLPNLLLFFFPEFLGPRWQPGDPISP